MEEGKGTVHKSCKERKARVKKYIKKPYKSAGLSKNTEKSNFDT